MDTLNNSFDSIEDAESESVLSALQPHQFSSASAVDEAHIQAHIKKLSDAFEGCIRQPQPESQMKVFLRIRPILTGSSAPVNSTIRATGNTTITTTAPDTSKRAQYTKTEERNYVSQLEV
jgi:hypothetical protein